MQYLEVSGFSGGVFFKTYFFLYPHAQTSLVEEMM